MALPRRPAAEHQRLVLTASAKLREPLFLEAVGCPIECLLTTREALQSGEGIDADWGTTAVYVLIGGPEIALGPGDPASAYDELLERSPSEEPPPDADATESIDAHEHTPHWRARFYTGLTREALRRMGEHLAKPWWNRALLCRQSPPHPYEIGDIGFLEGELHDLLDAAYWLKREGRATHEPAIKEDREIELRTGHLPAIRAAVRLLGVPLDAQGDVEDMISDSAPQETTNA